MSRDVNSGERWHSAVCFASECHDLHGNCPVRCRGRSLSRLLGGASIAAGRNSGVDSSALLAETWPTACGRASARVVSQAQILHRNLNVVVNEWFKFLRRRSHLASGWALFLALAVGCTTAPKPAPVTAGSSVSARNEGYANLYELLGKQRHLGKLLLIKRESSPVHAVVKEIARVSDDGYDQLKKFGKADATLNLTASGLPLAEVKTREAIEATRRKQLLGASGAAFELQLLLSQNEALTYGAHLARVVRTLDDQPARQAALTTLAQQMEQLQEEVLKL